MKTPVPVKRRPFTRLWQLLPQQLSCFDPDSKSSANLCLIHWARGTHCAPMTPRDCSSKNPVYVEYVYCYTLYLVQSSVDKRPVLFMNETDIKRIPDATGTRHFQRWTKKEQCTGGSRVGLIYCFCVNTVDILGKPVSRCRLWCANTFSFSVCVFACLK